MATFRLDTDDRGEVVFVEEENGTFQTPAAKPPWEREIEPAELTQYELGGASIRQIA